MVILFLGLCYRLLMADWVTMLTIRFMEQLSLTKSINCPVVPSHFSSSKQITVLFFHFCLWFEMLIQRWRLAVCSWSASCHATGLGPSQRSCQSLLGWAVFRHFTVYLEIICLDWRRFADWWSHVHLINLYLCYYYFI